MTIPFGLGIIADVASAHRHVAFAKGTATTQPPINLSRSIPSILSTASIVSMFQEVASTPSSGGSIDVAESVKPALLEDAVSHQNNHHKNAKASYTSDIASAASRSRKHVAASKTSFQLAHPPPAIKHRQRFHIRPKILLQLQQISDATRPVPVFDVLSSVVFAPKLAKRFPGLLKGKVGLGADDLLVVGSQNYESPVVPDGDGDDGSEGDGWDAREVVAAICQPKKRGTAGECITEICLNHGPVWEAVLLPSGIYEFSSHDESSNRTVARWVPRPPITRRRTYDDHDIDRLPLSDQRRFTFSIIDPNSRRHPVIATLNRSSVDILDRYSIPSPSSFSQNSPPASRTASAVLESPRGSLDEMVSQKPAMVETNEHLRSLIVITAIWVAFKEGFSPDFKYSKPAVAPSTAPSLGSHHKPRKPPINSANLAHGNKSSVESPSQERQFSGKSITESHSTISATPSPSATFPCVPLLQRSHTTGTAFFHQTNDRRRHPPTKSTQPSPMIPSYDDNAEMGFHHRKTSKNKFRNNASAGDPSIQETPPSKEGNSRLSDVFSKGSNVRPSNGETPSRGHVARKLSRLNKLFGFGRRTCSSH